MTTIECTAIIDETHRAVLQFPDDIAPGEHRIRLTIVETDLDNRADDLQGTPAGPRRWQAAPFPTYDLGPWPEGFTVSREQIYDDDGR